LPESLDGEKSRHGESTTRLSRVHGTLSAGENLKDMKRTCSRSPLTMRSKNAAPLRTRIVRFGDHVRSVGSKADLDRCLGINTGSPRISSGSHQAAGESSSTASASVPFALHPWRISPSADGALLFVTNLDSRMLGVHVLRALDGSYVRAFCEDSALSPLAICVHNQCLLVAESDQIHVIDISTETLVRKIGRSGDGDGDGDLSSPAGVCVFGDLVYVCDTNFRQCLCASSRVSVFRLSTGEFLRTISAHGSGPTAMGELTGMCLSPDGELLFVADGNHHCVHVFRTVDGAHVRTIGSKGSGDGQFNYPYDVCVSPSGEWLLVADLRNKRVQVLSASDGTHALTLDEDVVNHPMGMCVATQGASTLLYVTDRIGFDRIHAFSLQ
jgi:DNA-binding beta-propeller fold protein YncE